MLEKFVEIASFAASFRLNIFISHLSSIELENPDVSKLFISKVGIELFVFGSTASF